MPDTRKQTPEPDEGAPDDMVKDDPVEYFGADGEDEGAKYVESGEFPEDDDQTATPG